jgi:spore coat protein JB
MTEKEMMLKKLYALDFAIVELNLYLDTHPYDAEVSKKRNEYMKERDALREIYQKKYAPLTSGDNTGNRWDWISSPWPWDIETNNQK